MRNIKTKYIWISVVISFLIACGLIFAVTQTEGVWTNVVIVLIAVVFIYTTIAIQIAATRSFRYKPKPKHYTQKKFVIQPTQLDDLLKAKGYKPRVTPYGISYLKVDVPNAYKVVLIKDATKYFQPEESTTSPKPDKNLEKCQKFIGCEIFLDVNEEVLKKLPDFNIQGDKIYYAGYYVEDQRMICPNFLDPLEPFKDLYQTILSDLEISEEQESLD